MLTVINVKKVNFYREVDFMKKIILVVIAGAMLLSNVAFATTKTSDKNISKSHAVSSTSQFHLQINNPGGW